METLKARLWAITETAIHYYVVSTQYLTTEGINSKLFIVSPSVSWIKGYTKIIFPASQGLAIGVNKEGQSITKESKDLVSNQQQKERKKEDMSVLIIGPTKKEIALLSFYRKGTDTLF